VDGDGPRTPDAEASDPPPDAFYDTTPYLGLPLAADPAVPAGPADPAAPSDGGRAARRAPAPRPGTPSPAGRVILPIALAAVSIVALVAGWNHLQAEQTSAAALAPVSSPGPTGTAGPTATPTPTPSATPTPSPSASATRTAASPSASASSTASRSASPSATASFTVDRSVPVTVLNGTTRVGLAAAVAADLQAKGWRIVSTGNWRSGGIESTTVFVDGERDAAATMRKDLPPADATRSPIGQMKDGRITIVVMDDYPR
jgi:hypothetical protein